MDELNNKVNKEQYNKLKKELHDKQREAEYLQKQLDDRMAHANKMVIGMPVLIEPGSSVIKIRIKFFFVVVLVIVYCFSIFCSLKDI